MMDFGLQCQSHTLCLPSSQPSLATLSITCPTTETVCVRLKLSVKLFSCPFFIEVPNKCVKIIIYIYHKYCWVLGATIV